MGWSRRIVLIPFRLLTLAVHQWDTLAVLAIAAYAIVATRGATATLSSSTETLLSTLAQAQAGLLAIAFAALLAILELRAPYSIPPRYAWQLGARQRLRLLIQVVALFFPISLLLTTHAELAPIALMLFFVAVPSLFAFAHSLVIRPTPVLQFLEDSFDTRGDVSDPSEVVEIVQAAIGRRDKRVVSAALAALLATYRLSTRETVEKRDLAEEFLAPLARANPFPGTLEQILRGLETVTFPLTDAPFPRLARAQSNSVWDVCRRPEPTWLEVRMEAFNPVAKSLWHGFGNPSAQVGVLLGLWNRENSPPEHTEAVARFAARLLLEYSLFDTVADVNSLTIADAEYLPRDGLESDKSNAQAICQEVLSRVIREPARAAAVFSNTPVVPKWTPPRFTEVLFRLMRDKGLSTHVEELQVPVTTEVWKYFDDIKGAAWNLLLIQLLSMEALREYGGKPQTAYDFSRHSLTSMAWAEFPPEVPQGVPGETARWCALLRVTNTRRPGCPVAEVEALWRQMVTEPPASPVEPTGPAE